MTIEEIVKAALAQVPEPVKTHPTHADTAYYVIQCKYPNEVKWETMDEEYETFSVRQFHEARTKRDRLRKSLPTVQFRLVALVEVD